jgi:hypothetical protein
VGDKTGKTEADNRYSIDFSHRAFSLVFAKAVSIFWEHLQRTGFSSHILGSNIMRGVLKFVV